MGVSDEHGRALVLKVEKDAPQRLELKVGDLSGAEGDQVAAVMTGDLDGGHQQTAVAPALPPVLARA
jgi:hypothetical protein